MKRKVAIIGSGNIGSDLMMKIIRLSTTLEMGTMVGIDPDSDGLARARRLEITTTADGVRGLLELPVLDEIGIVFDATSARAHVANIQLLEPYDKILVDLTPAAVGPFVVAAVNLADHQDAHNVNMVTCGGQATIPIVAAVSRVTPVLYAETTARAIEVVGGAARGKAIIVLNPANPPMIMRDTVHCLASGGDPEDIRASVTAMHGEVSRYVPGYRLKQEVQITAIAEDEPLNTLIGDAPRPRWRVSVFLEVEGSAHYLPSYAGNLDIMTSTALHTGELLVARTARATRSDLTEVAP